MREVEKSRDVTGSSCGPETVPQGGGGEEASFHPQRSKSQRGDERREQFQIETRRLHAEKGKAIRDVKDDDTGGGGRRTKPHNAQKRGPAPA